METAHFFESSVNIYQTAGRHIPEDIILPSDSQVTFVRIEHDITFELLIVLK
jgi:hypothetical protein